MQKIRLLVVDDTKFMRQALTDIFSTDEALEVIGTAKNGREALELAQTLKPDVITMDIDMPTMDGLTALKHFMMKTPIPIVLVSALADDPEINFESWRLGSVEVVKKPSGSISGDIAKQKSELIAKVKKASKVNISAIRRVRVGQKMTQKKETAQQKIKGIVLVIGGSGALSQVIRFMQNPMLPAGRLILLMLDFPPGLLKAFNRRLNDVSNEPIIFAGDSITILNEKVVLISLEQEIRIDELENKISINLTGPNQNREIPHPENFPEHLRRKAQIVLLSSDLSISDANIIKWQKSGAVFFSATPETCLFPQFIRQISDSRSKLTITAVPNLGELY